MTHIARIFGPPGTGKTTRLLQVVERFLNEGIPAEEIAYLSFSKKAAEEAIDRATKQFGIPRKNFIYFRTIHSLAYQQAGMHKDEIMQFADYETIARLVGVKISLYTPEEDTIYGNEIGDQARSIHELSRAKMIPLQEEWNIASSKCPINFAVVEKWANTVEAYKKAKGMYDFSDMLEHYKGALPVRVFIIDEAQDLSKLQWHVVNQACQACEYMYIAGDDDQCIYNWNGADLHSFLNYAAHEDIILPQSFRVPYKILTLASNIANNIKIRKQKMWAPKAESGKIKSCKLEHLPLQEGNWMILVRNTRFIHAIEDFLQEQGLLYKLTRGKQSNSIDPEDALLISGWTKLQKGEAINNDIANKILRKISPHAKKLTLPEVTLQDFPLQGNIKQSAWYDVLARGLSPKKIEYIRKCLRHGSKLNDVPKITVSTIHKVKGGEAENVAIISDVVFNTYKSINDDDEHRVWYVGVTRAKENLYLLQPRTRMFYNFERLLA